MVNSQIQVSPSYFQALLMSPAAERYSAVTCPNRLSGMGFIMICLKPGVAGSAAEKYAKENGFTFEAMKPDYIKGDSDSDGKVTISDVRTTLRYVCQKVELDEEQKLAADVEKDGVINIKDLRKVLRFVCNKIEEL